MSSYTTIKLKPKQWAFNIVSGELKSGERSMSYVSTLVQITIMTCDSVGFFSPGTVSQRTEKRREKIRTQRKYVWHG